MATILCIEDEEFLRKDIVEELNEAEYRTLEASDGKEGLEKIVTSKPDLVICDILMPHMNGYEVLRELRENHPEFCTLPFIFLSALSDRKNEIAGRKLGADDYLTKPVDLELMLATVEGRLKQIARVNASKQKRMMELYGSIAKSDSTAPEEVESLLQHGGAETENMKIALVADGEVDLEHLVQALEEQGHIVLKFHSGNDFYELSSSLETDLLLVSGQTTDVDGLQLLRMLKQRQAIEYPVILLIPPSMARIHVGQLTEVDDYIYLPCDQEALFSKLEGLAVSWHEILAYI